MRYSLASVGILAPLLLNVEASVLSFDKRDSAPAAESNCKPPLPNILLQQFPPSVDDEALKPLLVKLQSAAATYATTASVDSVTIGVVGPQGLLWSGGFGKARANGTDDTPPNENTVYRIGSVSKLFAAMEGFVLQNKGYLNW